MSASDRSPPPVPDAFLLAACQGGAEGPLKARALAVDPDLRPAAWRRSIVTFRRPPAARPVDLARLAERLVFARTLAHSLGQVTGGDARALASAATALAAGLAPTSVHVWCRDHRAGLDPEEARAALLDSLGLAADLEPLAAPGSVVLDCVVDAADRWWVGWHRADWPAGRWPGGVYPLAAAPTTAVSRAWLKLDEALAAFGVPLVAGQRAAELGAAPGGACQRLLEAGLEVIGVDPAALDEKVATAAGFSHWRMRARDVPVRRFRGVDWLLADMNIDPRSTVAALGRIATARGVRLRGIVATLKIPDWSRAAELNAWLAAFREWGFSPRARQLSTAGREVCVVALRRPVTRRPARSPRGA